jgi:hypothetical protein
MIQQRKRKYPYPSCIRQISGIKVLQATRSRQNRNGMFSDMMLLISAANRDPCLFCRASSTRWVRQFFLLAWIAGSTSARTARTVQKSRKTSHYIALPQQNNTYREASGEEENGPLCNPGMDQRPHPWWTGEASVKQKPKGKRKYDVAAGRSPFCRAGRLYGNGCSWPCRALTPEVCSCGT